MSKKIMQNILIKISKLFLVFLFSIIAFSNVSNAATWSEPTCDPTTDPTSCNVAAPINVGSDNQTKTGALTISNALNANSVTATSGDITINSASGNLVVKGGLINLNTSAGVNKISMSGTAGTITASGLVTLTGSLAVNNSNITLTSGNFNITSGSIGVTTGNVSVTGGYVSTNTIQYTSGDMTITSGTSGTTKGSLNLVASTQGANIGSVYMKPGTSGYVYVQPGGSGGTYMNGSLVNSQTFQYAPGTLTIKAGAAATNGSIVLNANGTSAGNGDVSINPSASYGTVKITGPTDMLNNTQVKTGLKVTQTQNAIGLDIVSSTATTTSAAARITAANNTGLEVNTTDSAGIIVTANTAAAAGEYGVKAVTTGVGVYGNTLAGGNAGVIGCYEGENCGKLGLEAYAGFFEGDVLSYGSIEAYNEVIGDKFIPTADQYSVFPYNIHQKDALSTNYFFGDITNFGYLTTTGKSFMIYDMVWDGQNMWARAYNETDGVSSIVTFNSAGRVTYYSDLTYAYFNRTRGGITAMNNSIIYSGERKPALTTYCYYKVINKDDFTSTNFSFTANGCYSVINDGTYVIGQSTSNDNINIIDLENGLYNSFDVSSMDVSGVTLSCTDPKNLAWDGEYVWATCSGNDKVLKMKYSCEIVYNPSTGNDELSCDVDQASTYTVDDAPDLILYDGKDVWVSYSSSGAPYALVKYDGDSSGSILSPLLTFSTLNVGITDLEYDGVHVWASNNTDEDLFLINASSGDISQVDNGSDSNFLGFDGTTVFNSQASGAISTWSTSNGSFGTGASTSIPRGILINDVTGNLYCMYIYDQGGAAHFRVFHSAAAGSDEFAEYCSTR